MEQSPECAENKAVTEKKPVSKACVIGFALACIGLITIFSMMFWVRTEDVLIWTIVGAVIAEVGAQVLSLIGVITASVKHRRFRGLGIAGIVISEIIIRLVIFGVLGVLLFHESPPQPLPTYG